MVQEEARRLRPPEEAFWRVWRARMSEKVSVWKDWFRGLLS
jgi:hypothetical protein